MSTITLRVVCGSPPELKLRRMAGNCGALRSGKPCRERRELGERERLGPACWIHAGGRRRATDDVERQAEAGAERVRQHLPALGERRADDALEAARIGQRDARRAKDAQMKDGRVD